MDFEYGLSLTEDQEKQYTMKFRSCFTQEYSWFDVDTGEEAPSDVIIYFLKKKVFRSNDSFFELSRKNMSLRLENDKIKEEYGIR